MFARLKRWWSGRPDVCSCRQCKLNRAADLLAREHAQRARQESEEAEVSVGVHGGQVFLRIRSDGVIVQVPFTTSEAWEFGEGLQEAAKQARDEGVQS